MAPSWRLMERLFGIQMQRTWSQSCPKSKRKIRLCHYVCVLPASLAPKGAVEPSALPPPCKAWLRPSAKLAYLFGTAKRFATKVALTGIFPLASCWLLLAKEQDADRMVGWDKGKVSGRVWCSSRGKYSSLPREEFFSPEENDNLIPHRKMVRGDGKDLSLRCKGIFAKKG